MRTAYAIKQLLTQVDGAVVGDPDEMGVRRSAVVPAEHAAALVTDTRVAAVSVVGSEAFVDLVTGQRADDRRPFRLG